MSKSKKTGQDWSELLEIRILSPDGWSNHKQFASELITKLEFLNRAAVSTVEKRADISRRAIAKILKEI